MSAMVDSLREVPLFADLPPRDLRRLADSMQALSFAPGKEVVSEGKGGVGFFVILDGAARVTLRCAAMTPWTFRPFVRDHPDVAWALLTALVKRLRETQARQVAATG